MNLRKNTIQKTKPENIDSIERFVLGGMVASGGVAVHKYWQIACDCLAFHLWSSVLHGAIYKVLRRMVIQDLPVDVDSVLLFADSHGVQRTGGFSSGYLDFLVCMAKRRYGDDDGSRFRQDVEDMLSMGIESPSCRQP